MKLKNIKLKTFLNFFNIDENINISNISKTTNTTYNSAWSLIKLMERMRVVTKIKKGRQYKINFTERGKKLKMLFIQIDQEIGDDDGATNRNNG